MSITNFVDNKSVFAPDDIKAMSTALADVCKTLNIIGDPTAREVVAARIVELARRGERSPRKLRDQVLAEANGQTATLGGTS